MRLKDLEDDRISDFNCQPILTLTVKQVTDVNQERADPENRANWVTIHINLIPT